MGLLVGRFWISRKLEAINFSYLRIWYDKCVPHECGDEPALVVLLKTRSHTRGDEPESAFFAAVWSVFPTPVGMNRKSTHLRGDTSRVPHTRGDEPLFLLCYVPFPTSWG